MKLRMKLQLGFLSILIVVTVFFGVSISAFNQTNRNINNTLQSRYERNKLSTAIQHEINDISRYFREIILLDPAGEDFVKNINLIRSSRQQVELMLNSREALAERDSMKDLLMRIRNINQDYIDLQEEVIALAVSGNHEDAIRIINDGAATRDQIFKYIDELMELEEKALDDTLQSSAAAYNRVFMSFFLSILLALLVGAGITIWTTRKVTGKIQLVTAVMNRVTLIREHVDLPRIDIKSKDEVGEIATAFNAMTDSLEEHARLEKESMAQIEGQNWLKSGIAEIADLCQGVIDLKTLAQLLITKITPMVDASYGVFYIRDGVGEGQCFSKLAAYADSPLESARKTIRLGEGLVGQCAVENRAIMLDRVPGDYIKITSGLGMTKPKSIIIVPVAFEDQVVAVIELASFQVYTILQRELLEQMARNIGITINRVEAHMKIRTLLNESQVLTEELQSQSEELQQQQEELKALNEKLDEQYKYAEKRALELENTKAALEEKAWQMEENSKYKTEFLSNMSHELRTPLNSLLILSQTLAENREGNLTAKQVEYIKTIYSSGNELLALINDILDLAKIEAGKVSINTTIVELAAIKDYVERYFTPVALQKKLDFIVQMDEDLPESIYTDEHRLLQILKNLLSNAIKFTDRGNVSLRVQRTEKPVITKTDIIINADLVLAFSVTDTGIGIPPGKQNMVFGAFQQVDGTTVRKYGGTGLGLSISQNYARLLGGFIDLNSVEGAGSTFTLYLPGYDANQEVPGIFHDEAAATKEDLLPPLNKSTEQVTRVADETQLQVTNGNPRLEGKKILVVDDDMRNVFALTTALENQKIIVLFAENGREGIEMVQKNPDVDLVLMDIMMPEMNGYEAIRRIRRMPEHANLPIIALTAKAMKNDREKCIQAGASDYISKPVNLEQLFSLIKIWLYR